MGIDVCRRSLAGETMPNLFLLLMTVALFLIFYRKRKRHMELFQQLQIPGPKPHWLFGNLASYSEKQPFEKYQEWTKEYGSVYGIYEGAKPVIVTSDLDLLQEVFIKQFSIFNARKDLPIMPDPEKDKNISMFLARGRRWKRLRTITNPIFSCVKLKQMVVELNSCIDVLLQSLEAGCDVNQSIDIMGLFKRLTMDMIMHCALGINTHAQSDSNDPYLKRCMATFKLCGENRWLKALALLLPELRMFFYHVTIALTSYPENPNRWLRQRVRDHIDERRIRTTCEDKEKRKDLLQLLLDAEDPTFKHDAPPYGYAGSNGHPNGYFTSGNSHAGQGNDITRVKKSLTKEEAANQGWLFLLAGYETTSTALAYITYCLAKNPDVQERLVGEIRQHVQRENDISYDEVSKMEYLDMVLRETLRLYPMSSSVMARECTAPVAVGRHHLPQGMAVQADVWSIHYNPNIYPDPEQFIPERFSAANRQERHPLAWLPFGAGPRNCVGQRFALIECKLTICRMLLKFKIERSAETPDKLVMRETVSISPPDGIKVRLVRRDQGEGHLSDSLS